MCSIAEWKGQREPSVNFKTEQQQLSNKNNRGVKD